MQRTTSKGKIEEWNPPDFLSVTGNDVYASFPNEGLFVYRNALVTGERHPETAIGEFRLYQSYPNPMRSEAIISYSIPRNERGEILIMNLLGRIIKQWPIDGNDMQQSFLRWDGTNDESQRVPSGVYRCVLRSGKQKKAISLRLLR